MPNRPRALALTVLTLAVFAGVCLLITRAITAPQDALWALPGAGMASILLAAVGFAAWTAWRPGTLTEDDPIPLPDNEARVEHIAGMTLVDAYHVPDAEVEQYIADRERLARRAMEIYASVAHSVSRDWAGSQDGEAVVARDAAGEIIALIHLDPDGIALMRDEEAKGTLRDTLLAGSGR